ncbi:uncharacterized protein LOC105156773 [Sesamum indicum]|uniref:Uncharacterized protein LOC105156773 n=1 Tax=Sesamum indicum TaxID=4182 RepID=A0A6I9SQ13_SESIN|nr:uncharacterized protein LOC105156773 [Sesamum indicum]
MAPTSYSYLFAAVAALLLLGAAQGPFAEANAGVNQFCVMATYKDLCSAMAKGASTLQTARANVLQTALDEARSLKGLVPKLMPAINQLPSKSKTEVLQTCTEDFDGTISDIEESIKALQVGDMGTAQTHLSAALRRDCRDAIQELGVNSPLTNYATELTRRVDSCMAVLTQKTSSR